VPTVSALNPCPRSIQVGEFEVAIGGGIWVAIRVEKTWVSCALQTDAYTTAPPDCAKQLNLFTF
jgi:hypothetical protein